MNEVMTDDGVLVQTSPVTTTLHTLDMPCLVGIAQAKLAQVLALRAEGVDLAVILDTVAQAKAVAAASREAGTPIPAAGEVRIAELFPRHLCS